ncbi:phosphotransferase enzyme family protein [Nocardia asiatica]|uniref:phosphotransferase enzyme family protein n=1 Tax=Nocardia asiatica TaxID=209252 RepID=UPI0002EF5D50|nr:phosphotransferase [Nocardia asiatica]
MTQLSDAREHELRSALLTICDVVGLDAEDATLIKYTNNVVWRLASPVVVRIGVGAIGRARAPRVARLARWLTERAAPVPRLMPELAQPVILDDFAATFWEWLPGADDQWEVTDLAAPMRAIHGLDVPADVEAGLPHWNPFAAARQRLEAADPILPASDRAWLSEQWEHVEGFYSQLPPSPHGIIHGDAHTGNLLRDDHGRAILCDLDSAGIGPLPWDLAISAVDALRFGPRHDFARLTAAYGRDFTTEPAWPALLRIRELGLVTSVLPDLARRPDVAAEHARRLRALRDGDSTEPWRPYQ